MTHPPLIGVATVVSVVTAGLQPSAIAADALAAHFPADCVAYVRISGEPQWIGQAAGSAVWANAQAVSAGLDRLFGMLCLNSGEALGLTPAETAQLRAALKQVSLAWFPVPNAPARIAGAALLSDPAVGANLLSALQTRGFAQPVQLAGKPAWQVTVADLTAWVYQAGPAVVVWPDNNRAAQMIVQPPANLAAAPGFARAAAEPAAGAPVWAWADVAQAGPLWLNVLPAEGRPGWTAFLTAFGLDKTACAAAAFGGPPVAGGPADLTTVRLWLSVPSPLLTQLAAGAPVGLNLGSFLPAGVQWLAWGSADKAATVWPLLKPAAAALESSSPAKPISTLSAALEAATKTSLDALVAELDEFALAVLAPAKQEPLEDRVAVLLRAKSAQAAEAWLGRLDAAVLAATSQPAERKPEDGYQTGRWALPDKRPVGFYAFKAEVIVLAAKPTALAAAVAAIKAGDTLAAKTKMIDQLKTAGPAHFLVAGSADQFLAPAADLAAVRALVNPQARVACVFRFLPDGLQLQTNLPAPVLTLLAATESVK